MPELTRNVGAALLAALAVGTTHLLCLGCTTEGQSDARSLVSRLHDAHGGSVGYEIAFRVPVANTPEVAHLLDSAAQLQPAMAVWADPDSGASFRVAYIGTIAGDSRGRTRILTRTLYLGGPESGATNAELWHDAERITTSGIGAATGTLDRYDPLTVHQEAAQRAQGRVSFEFMRAQSEYLALARYVARVLSAADDLAGPRPTSAAADSVCSRAWGLVAEIDRETGELTRAMLTDELGAAALYEFRGRHDSPLYPARQPRECRVYDLSGSVPAVPACFPVVTPSDLRRVVLFDSAQRVDSHSDDQFQWQSIAARVLDRRAGELVHRDGTRTPAPSPSRNAPANRPALVTLPSAPDGRVGVAPAPRTTRNVLIVAGCASMLLAAIVWLRRKLQ